jgi:hypothetical protein
MEARAVAHGETLHLTSPLIRSDGVREVQELLRHNPYGTFDPGEVDGVYGERTAMAARRAKYWIGYPEKEVDSAFTPQLRAYLSGQEPLPSSFAATRSRRLRRADRHQLWTDAFDFAMSELGESEAPPGSNRTTFSEWYGLVGPWGVMFASWCYAQAGSRAFAPGRAYAYAPHLLADAQRAANNLSITEDPLQGDLIMYDLDGDAVADHVGMFDAWRDANGRELRAIEGVSSAEGENGGEVMLRNRRIDQVLAFVHVRA